MSWSAGDSRGGDRCRVAVLGRVRQHRLLLPRWSAPCSSFWLQPEAQCDSKTDLEDLILLFDVMQGIWVGVLIGTVLQTVILFVILVRTKWQKEVH